MLDLDPLDREVAPRRCASRMRPATRRATASSSSMARTKATCSWRATSSTYRRRSSTPDGLRTTMKIPAAACEARARWVEDARSERWLVAFSHFGRPFGRVEPTAGRRSDPPARDSGTTPELVVPPRLQLIQPLRRQSVGRVRRVLMADDRAKELVAVERQEPALGRGDDGRRPGDVPDQRDLAEAIRPGRAW